MHSKTTHHHPKPASHSSPNRSADQRPHHPPATPGHPPQARESQHTSSSPAPDKVGRAAEPAGPVPTFASLHLAEPILRAVSQEGYTTPTPIQTQAIPHIIAGKDVLGCAQTGTGKTAAFALPILHRLAGPPARDAYQPHANQHRHRPIRALILSPTRELALQIDESFRTYGRHARLRTACVFGGVSQNVQTRALREGVDILVATPGRLMDLMQQGYIDLAHVEVFVLDEADRMLDMGFIDPIRRISSKLPTKRQTLLFSATMPKQIRHLADSLLTHPVSVEVAAVASTPDLVEQSVFLVPKRDKTALLAHFIANNNVQRVLVFTRTKHGADRVARDLCRGGVRADAIHGNKRQNVRQRTLEQFRSGRTPVLVATDIAARGIDVDGISHVVNFDLPNEPEAYVHRIGRTARAGTKGQAVSFCDQSGDERDYLRLIERLIRKPIRVRADLPAGLAAATRAAAHASDDQGDDARAHRSARGHAPRSQGRPHMSRTSHTPPPQHHQSRGSHSGRSELAQQDRSSRSDHGPFSMPRGRLPERPAAPASPVSSHRSWHKPKHRPAAGRPGTGVR